MSWDITNEEQWTYKDVPTGVVAIEGGVSKQYVTGGWRTVRPIWNTEKCKHCLICWVSCPDSCIQVSDKKMTGIDLVHCKGCGVCVTECPFDALSLMNEEDAKGVQACQL